MRRPLRLRPHRRLEPRWYLPPALACCAQRTRAAASAPRRPLAACSGPAGAQCVCVRERARARARCRRRGAEDDERVQLHTPHHLASVLRQEVSAGSTEDQAARVCTLRAAREQGGTGKGEVGHREMPVAQVQGCRGRGGSWLRRGVARLSLRPRGLRTHWRVPKSTVWCDGVSHSQSYSVMLSRPQAAAALRHLCALAKGGKQGHCERRNTQAKRAT
jgi:hypothetical protein